MPDESRHEGLVNHRYILRTLFGLMMHTEAGHRLTAVAAIRRCIGCDLMKHRVLFDEYALEILKVSFRSISRSGEHFCTVGMSTRGADVAMAVVVREVLQAMKSQEITHAQLSGSAFSESTEPFLEDLLEYTLSEDSFLQREAQQTFCAVAPFMIQDVQQWFHLHSSDVNLYRFISSRDRCARARRASVKQIHCGNSVVRLVYDDVIR